METSGSQPSLRLVGSRIPARAVAEPPASLPIGDYERCRREIDDLARLLLGDDDTPRAA